MAIMNQPRISGRTWAISASIISSLFSFISISVTRVFKEFLYEDLDKYKDLIVLVNNNVFTTYLILGFALFSLVVVMKLKEDNIDRVRKILFITAAIHILGLRLISGGFYIVSIYKLNKIRNQK